MANFKTCVRNKSTDGLYNVYIRVTHNRKLGYIRTTLRIPQKSLKGNEIKDNNTILQCAKLIEAFTIKLNTVSTSSWTVTEIIEYLKKTDESVSFTDFAKKYINRLINEDRLSTSSSYRNSVNNLSNYIGKSEFNFSDITKKEILGWIESLKDTNRAKNLYPTCIKAIFEQGIKEYNDYDRDSIKIKNQPFFKVIIPKSVKGEKKAIDKKYLLKIFLYKTEGVRMGIAKDVATLIFCLAGINCADLYDLRADSLKEWKLCYNRKKTRGERDDNAYIEITVPEKIRYLFDKYKGRDRLFIFSDRYSTSQDFSRYMDRGLKSICEDLAIDKVTTYTFRHSWATIAQNDCGASTEQVAFALNHVSAHKITEGYIKKDYSPIDKLNNKVLKFVFG